MNKMVIVVSALFMVGCIQQGLTLGARTMDIRRQINDISLQNAVLADEFRQKEQWAKTKPKALPEAFALLVNETRMFESYGGTRMDIILGSKENEDIEDHYVDTPFRGVKGLPLTIGVEKFSNETDMVEVLNDIYLLENHTDFKVSEISADNNTLTVKGELYGI